ncbi:MAG: TCP-1/cpn60 chaperonin family protein, partial [Chloroflexota bacterium]
VEEGVVPGGGVAYLRTLPALEPLLAKLDGDERTGARLVMKALESPLRQIVENAGREASVIVNEVRDAKANYGYDAEHNKMGDMFELGIIDPVKVTRVALENAVSVASLMLTTEAAVGELPAPPAPPMPPGGGMDF